MSKLYWKKFTYALLAVLLLFSLAPASGVAKKDNPDELKEYDVGTHGMVSTSHTLASKVGADVLKKGGNAMDAAIAIQFALNVVEPMMSGIGGGGFMMVYDAEADDVTIINSRERAPAGATPDMFLDENGNIIPFGERSTHGNAVGVPGTLKGLETAHEKWGSRSLQQLITPAIHLADKGFAIDEYLARMIASNEDKLSATAAKDVFLPDGEPLEAGEWLQQKDLAKTLKLIRAYGTDAFYNGEIGQALADVVQDFGGSMTTEDLANYDVTEDEPVYGDYKNYEIASMPPPSSGGLTLLQMLKLLEDFDIGQYGENSVEKYHLLSEAMKISYADRAAYIGDPEFVDVPMNGMLHPDYIEERRALIDLDEANQNVEAGDPWQYEDAEPAMDVVEQADDKEMGETTHFTVADKWGNVVSYTTTIEQVFGTGIMVPGYGLMLNNEITDFDARPGGANEVQPNKRPMSSMTPTMVLEDGKPVLTLGSPGGPRIIVSVLQVFLNLVEYDMGLKEAIEAPRIYNSHTSAMNWEEGIPSEVRSELAAMGHTIGSQLTIGNVQSIQIDYDKGLFYGASDSRRIGAAIGINKPGKSHSK
ncbi:gamma-glutamyltransferase [Bacillus sp. Marseille-Q3570]|uniref:gamma-glutamyltransferase n=1 Tax=Bacillus sp. Marseille-Q3570 TaxID=2963522 RepID=UPI0021B77BD1|nr:gamma-glutamyltransferase [Bacillus sp. Marseille-Q3570]